MKTAHLALIAALIATVIWGATVPIAKYTFQEIPPFITAFLRFSLATVIFFPILGFENKLSSVKIRDYPTLALLAFLGVTLSIGLFFIGLSLTSAIDAGVIVSTGPVFNALAARFFLKEKISGLHWVGTGLASLGTLVIIVLQPLLDGSAQTSGTMLGNFILVLAVISSTAFNILSKESFEKYDASTIIGFSFLFGALSFLPLAIWEAVQNPLWSDQLTSGGLLGLLFLGVFASLVAYLLYEWALEQLPVTRTLAMTFLQPVVTVLIAIPLLGETINAAFLTGAALILGGMILATHRKPHHHHSSNPTRPLTTLPVRAGLISRLKQLWS